jgi:serine/threonine protein kinase
MERVQVMPEREYKSVLDWIKAAYHPGVKACTVKIREWYQGRYQIEEFLGAGHTSVVFNATDTRLDRIAALKLWQTRDLDLDPAILLKEARYLARVEHPRIVRVIDFGTDTFSNLPWMSLEFLGRRTLRNLIQETGGLHTDWLTVVEVGIQVGGIVDYIHSSVGLFQLDLKPDNFAFDSRRNVKLMDLGSAADDRDRFDRFGTPGYVAPELLESRSVDSKCDIFAMGVLLYELLVGENPLMAHQEQLISRKGRWADYSTAAIPLEPLYTSEKPFSRSVREFDPASKLTAAGVPTQFSALLTQMCSEDPRVRPTASECEAALLKLIEPSKTVQRPSVFISHSHLDKERFITNFCQAMSRRGFKVWIDELSLKTGESFWERIGAAIQSCDFVIVVLSQNSLKSHGVLEELRTAQIFNLDKVKILPIRIDPINYSDIPVHLRARHILDFVGWEDQKVLNARIAKLASDILSLWEGGSKGHDVPGL